MKNITIMHKKTNTKRNLKQAVVHGIFGKCPHCGCERLFSRYLKVQQSCPNCTEELHHHRADDAPTWITLILLGHLLMPMVLLIETKLHPAFWAHAIIWPPITIGLCLFLLPRAKGGIVGLQWALRMHGFDGADK